MNRQKLSMATVYIASSWRNAHGVELLTSELRMLGYVVRSWVENNCGKGAGVASGELSLEEWVVSPQADLTFSFDTRSAMHCDVFIYYGPSGKDACAELGIAWAAKEFGVEKRILGLWSKGEDLGLMRKMVDTWFYRPHDLLADLGKKINNGTESLD